MLKGQKWSKDLLRCKKADKAKTLLKLTEKDNGKLWLILIKGD